MKIQNLILLLSFLIASISQAQTPTTDSPRQVPTADTPQQTAPLDGSLIAFKKVITDEYGENLTVQRAEINNPDGTSKVIIDQVTTFNTYNNFQPPSTVAYHCKLFKDDKKILDQTITDARITGLLSDSHVATVQIPDSSAGADTGLYKSPVGFLVFQKKLGAHPRMITVLSEGTGGNALTISVDRYAFTRADNDPNEQITTYDLFNVPTVWAINGNQTIRRAKKAHKAVAAAVSEESVTAAVPAAKSHKKMAAAQPPVEDEGDGQAVVVHYVNYRPIINNQISPELTGRLESQLKTEKDPVTLYMIHLELAKLYTAQAALNASSPLDAFGKMAKAQSRAALISQPQAPLKDWDGSARIPSFTFKVQVEDPTGVNGLYDYKLFRLDSAGKVSAVNGALIDSTDLDPNRQNQNGKGFINPYAQAGMGSLSPTGLYRVEVDQDRANYGYNMLSEIQNLDLIVTSVATGKQEMIPMPDMGSYQALGWLSTQDLFYLEINTSQNQGMDLWQFNPATKELKKIGYTGRDVSLSPDSQWLLWSNGGTPYNTGTSGFNAFNIEKGVSYRLTHGLEPKLFGAWDSAVQP